MVGGRRRCRPACVPALAEPWHLRPGPRQIGRAQQPPGRYPGGVAGEVDEQTGQGSVYGVTVTRSDGTAVEVRLDKDFHVLDTQPAGDPRQRQRRRMTALSKGEFDDDAQWFGGVDRLPVRTSRTCRATAGAVPPPDRGAPGGDRRRRGAAGRSWGRRRFRGQGTSPTTTDTTTAPAPVLVARSTYRLGRIGGQGATAADGEDRGSSVRTLHSRPPPLAARLVASRPARCGCVPRCRWRGPALLFAGAQRVVEPVAWSAYRSGHSSPAGHRDHLDRRWRAVKEGTCFALRPFSVAEGTLNNDRHAPWLREVHRRCAIRHSGRFDSEDNIALGNIFPVTTPTAEPTLSPAAPMK